VLGEEVLPAYYQHPDRWVAMMLESIRSTRDAFGVKRMLDEYYERMYLKA